MKKPAQGHIAVSWLSYTDSPIDCPQVQSIHSIHLNHTKPLFHSETVVEHLHFIWFHLTHSFKNYLLTIYSPSSDSGDIVVISAKSLLSWRL